MRALIVDDERLARNELRRLLTAFSDIEIVGEAADSVLTRKQIATLKPDLLFLDVQMPEETGVQLLESLEPPVPLVVFTTAYHEFAVKAFELNAIDYLLKPVDPIRLAATIERLRSENQFARMSSVPGSSSSGRLAPEDKVFVRDGDKCWFLQVKQIRLLENDGSYTRVHFENEKPSLFRSLLSMEERLDPKYFFRANRTQIINLDWVDQIQPWFGGGLIVYLKGGAKIEMSRRQAQDFRDKLSL